MSFVVLLWSGKFGFIQTTYSYRYINKGAVILVFVLWRITPSSPQKMGCRGDMSSSSLWGLVARIYNTCRWWLLLLIWRLSHWRSCRISEESFMKQQKFICRGHYRPGEDIYTHRSDLLELFLSYCSILCELVFDRERDVDINPLCVKFSV